MNKVLLMILDGYGYTSEEEGNAVIGKYTPNLEKLYEENPHLLLECSGLSVGLPKGQMGNSEVGHLNIGAGRVIYQELTRISKDIEEGTFFKNEEFLKSIENVKKNNSALHLMGLCSDGGVHSVLEHLYGLLELAKRNNIEKVYIHCFMDGRDTPPLSGIDYLKELQEKIKEIGVGKIASVIGRYYAMDRDNRMERTKLAYDALVYGNGEVASSPIEAIENAHKENTTDEFILPTVIIDNDGPVGTIKDNDSVIFFNYRPDRARQITKAIAEDDFDGFERINNPKVDFVSFTKYDASFKNVRIAFKPQVINNTLGEYLSNKGLSQLRIAETEKYAHVTYFFNGGIEKDYPLEDRVLIPSPKVATYDLQPEMSAYPVTEKLVEIMDEKDYNFIVVNYANCDMVGHTGDMEAAILASKAVDECTLTVANKAMEKGYHIIITSDHGNAEKMGSEDDPYTAHTVNPVRCIIMSEDVDKVSEGGALCDLAPTVLDLMKVDIPKEMTGKSLIVK